MLDFGIARRALARPFAKPSGQTLGSVSARMTKTGVVIGTPAYMAPEQARGQKDASPASDVFSLGCVLFECLAGQPPFSGEHIAAVLAKILFDEAPRLRSLRKELPEALEALLMRMLAKQPEERPRDAQSLLAEFAALEALGPLEELDAPPPHIIVTVPGAIQGGEQQLFSVIYAAESAELVSVPTLDAAQAEARLALLNSLRTELLVNGVHAERLADGSLVATVTTTQAQTAATDQAAMAAHSALLIAEKWPEARVAITTGRGVLRAEHPVGEAVDRAVRLLRQAIAGANHPIVLDATTAGLLDARFELLPLHLPGKATMNAPSFALISKHRSLDVGRPLLGKPTPCVGREKELEMLSQVLLGCIEDAAARAVLLVAAAGVGKSRLRHEFLRLLEKRPETEKVAVLYARADPAYTGAGYTLFGQALRRFFDLDGLRAPLDQWRELRARVALRMPATEAKRVAECLGEIIGLPVPAEPSPIVDSARAEPRRLADLVATGLAEYLAAECAVQPLLLVLEDLQWGDAPSLRLSETVLRMLSEQPLLVLGLSRPELEERFPRLWHERGRQELRIPPLSRRASEQLVLRVLGKKTPAATVARIITQAGGNALLLEELIRAVADGKGDELPDTVLAMVQARIGRLDAPARRVLRTASVFGDTFSLGGVRALFGPDTSPLDIESSLQLLMDAELVEPSLEPFGQSQNERIFTFRYSLLREGAYSLLTEEDRKLGHRLAAEYLSHQCIPDPQRIADHYDRAGERAQAIEFFLQAAERALRSGDLQTTQQNCDRVAESAPSGQLLGRLHALRSQLSLMAGDVQAAIAHNRMVFSLMPPGSEAFCRAVATHAASAGMLAQPGFLDGILEQFEHAVPEPAAYDAFVVASALVAGLYTHLGMREAALGTLGRAESLAGGVLEADAFAECFFFRSLGMVQKFLGQDPWLTRMLFVRSLAAAQRMQHPRQVLMNAAELYLHEAQIGQADKVEEATRALCAQAQAFDEPMLQQSTQAALIGVLVATNRQEKLAEARALAEALKPRLNDNVLMVRGLLQCMYGEALSQLGELEAAISELGEASELLILMPGLRPIALSLFLLALVKRKDVQEAARAAAEAEDLLSMLGHAGSFEPVLRLGIAEALLLTGERERAQKMLRTGRDLLLAAAASFPDEETRQRYLTRVPYHARLLEIADSGSYSQV